MHDCRDEFVNEVLAGMQEELSDEQLYQLKNCLSLNLQDVKLEKATYELSVDVDDNYKYLKMFVASRRLEGMSENTLRSYVFYTKAFLETINKNFRDITAIDIQWYMANYEVVHGISRRSLDNLRKGINGWFIWLEETENIPSNPFRKVHKIAYDKKPVVTLSDDEIVLIREYLHGDKYLRTRAIVEFLLATGVRVSELCAVDVTDVDFINSKVIIHSAKKHHKEDRICFLTPEARKYLQDYLLLRERKGWDKNPALFQSNKKDGKRITERIVNEELRKLETACNINKKITVHIFRKTLASILHRRGMCAIDIAQYLGHEDSRTSETYYINVSIDNLQYNYSKYR